MAQSRWFSVLAPVAALAGLAGVLSMGKKKGLKGEVARENTKLSPAEALDVIMKAFSEIEGQAPSDKTWALLTAQSALETGHWESMRNWNFGNLVKGAADVPYVTINGRKWRAYQWPIDGAKDWLLLLKRRYPEAWLAALDGDAPSFVTELKAGGYFEEPVTPYIEAVQSLQGRFLRLIGEGPVS